MPVESDYKPISIYRRRDLKPKQILFCEAYLANGFNAVGAARDSGYKSPEQNAHLILQRKAVQKYLKNKANKLLVKGIDYDYKLQRLQGLIEIAVEVFDDTHNTNHAQTAMNAIDMLNKMQGHYAPTQTQAVTVNVKATQDKLLEAKKAYDEY